MKFMLRRMPSKVKFQITAIDLKPGESYLQNPVTMLAENREIQVNA